MNNLHVLKTMNGENVISELVLDNKNQTVVLLNPIIIQVENGVTMAKEFMPGLCSDVVPINGNFIAAGPNQVSEFYSKFYGTSILHLTIQRETQLLISRGEKEMSPSTLIRIEEKKQELQLKYGLLDGEGDDEEREVKKAKIKRALH